MWARRRPVHSDALYEVNFGPCGWPEAACAARGRCGVCVCGVTGSNVHNNSPDLNAIEGWWRVLRERLEDTEPQYFEDWGAFLVRLRRTAKWLHEHRSEDGLALCTNQKQRADDVIALDGGKTKW